MSSFIIIFFVIAVIIRLSSLAISIRNENKLKQEGGKEYGKLNSSVLAILHTLFYFSAFFEGWYNKVQWDKFVTFGLIVYLFSIGVLFYVISQLSNFWTVKLIIAKKHPRNTSFLFKYVRHPNYYLNIIPELIGLGLIMKAEFVLIYFFPVYLVSLAVRIIQEERTMDQLTMKSGAQN